MTALDPYAVRKEAQLARALAAMPGLQTSITTGPGGAVYRLRISADGFEDVVIIGRQERVYVTRKGRKRIVTHAEVDLSDLAIDQVLARWRNREPALLPFVVRD